MQETPTLTLPSRLPNIAERAVKLAEGFRVELDQIKKQVEARENSMGLQSVMDGLAFAGQYGMNQDTSTLPFTLANSNAWVPITLNRILLSYSYMSQGLVRTVINQPVEDAFRGGVRFKSGELEDEDLQKLNRSFKRKRGRYNKKTKLGQVSASSGYNQTHSDQDAIKQTLNWGRLYGGAGLMINTDQNFRSEFNPEALNEDSPLEFIACDRWEMILQQINIDDDLTPTPFNYYGLPIHRSRVSTINGPEAPSYIRMRLQGWGMSVLEDAMRAINTYLKFEKLLFELLDEAKIDVYKIEGFNASLASAAGSEKIHRRVALSNQMKNFQSALTMDMKDDYQQKTLTFTGIAQIYQEVRINFCAYMRIPYNKIFGQSSGGFSSGKDALDNYNSTIEGIRETAEPLVRETGELRCQQLFGFIPEDLEVEWSPLDVLDGVEQEAVKTSKQTRIVEQFTSGLLNGKEASESLKKEELLLVESEVLQGITEAVPPLSQNPDETESAQKHEIGMAKASAKPKPANE